MKDVALPVFVLCNGDFTKVPELDKMKVTDIYKFYYLKRVETLNEKLGTIAYLKHINIERK